MRRCIYKKIHYLTFDLDLGVKVTQNVAQFPLHHVTYASAKFDVLHPMVKEKMHLQENTLFDLNLGGSRSQEMLPSAIYIM